MVTVENYVKKPNSTFYVNIKKASLCVLFIERI